MLLALARPQVDTVARFRRAPPTTDLFLALHREPPTVKDDHWEHAVAAQHINQAHAVVDVPAPGSSIRKRAAPLEQR
jgi:hypothetical protein